MQILKKAFRFTSNQKQHKQHQQTATGDRFDLFLLKHRENIEKAQSQCRWASELSERTNCTSLVQFVSMQKSTPNEQRALWSKLTGEMSEEPPVTLLSLCQWFETERESREHSLLFSSQRIDWQIILCSCVAGHWPKWRRRRTVM